MQSFRSPEGPVIPCLHMIPLHVLTKENVYHLRLWIGDKFPMQNRSNALISEVGHRNMSHSFGSDHVWKWI